MAHDDPTAEERARAVLVQALGAFLDALTFDTGPLDPEERVARIAGALRVAAELPDADVFVGTLEALVRLEMSEHEKALCRAAGACFEPLDAWLWRRASAAASPTVDGGADVASRRIIDTFLTAAAGITIVEAARSDAVTPDQMVRTLVEAMEARLGRRLTATILLACTRRQSDIADAFVRITQERIDEEREVGRALSRSVLS